MRELENNICNNIAELNKIKQSVCILIAERRKSTGMTQQQAADWFNISVRTYIDIEKGNCTIENLCIVADKFDIELKLTFVIH